MSHFRFACMLAVFTCVLAACDRQGQPASGTTAAPGKTLVEARKGFVTQLPPAKVSRERLPVEVPPPGSSFRLVKYPSRPGGPELPAYLSAAPADGKNHPAIVWITGGDCNSIGSVWHDDPPENDQTARAFRDAGVVMMFPALRGGNDTPGRQEGFLGEVDDVIAAGEFLARQPGVDPQRVYLGGHSTGGTLVLLVAECAPPRFRAVFSFGPVDDPAGYGPDRAVFDVSNEREVALRSPIHWLAGVAKPTFVIEGAQRGNAESLRAMKLVNTNPAVRFIELKGGNHFNILRPVQRVLAAKVVAATAGNGVDFNVTEAELAEALRTTR